MTDKKRARRMHWTAVVLVLAAPLAASAQQLDSFGVERAKKLREVERYQLNIAQKFYADKNWKAAAAEYEKYITLYERSEAASYAQLRWSLCLVHLRKQHTAIKEGFRAVIDYWPESEDAVAAAYYIGDTLQDIGEIALARKAFKTVLNDYPEHPVAAYAMNRLIDISRIEEDVETRLALWKKLTFETKRAGREVNNICVKASQDLAVHYFYNGAFQQAVEALATTYAEYDLPREIRDFGDSALSHLTGDDEKKLQGEKLADQMIAYIKQAMPTDRGDEKQVARMRQYWFYIADIQHYARRTSEVPKVYQQMIDLFGVDDGILGRLAQWYKGQNRYEDARATYRRFENKIEGLNQVAYSYREEDKIPPAVETYRRISLEDPENSVKWIGEIASTYYNAHQWEHAIKTYEELMAVDKENPERWRPSIAQSYQRWGKYKEAIAQWRQCTNFPSNYINMASCHRALKEWGEALTLYNQIGGQDPGRASWAMFQRARVFEDAGKPESAIKEFQRVCKTFPETGEASQAHARLQSEYKITITLGGGTKGTD